MPIVPTTTGSQVQASNPLEVDSAKSWVCEKINTIKADRNRPRLDHINQLDSRQYVYTTIFISCEDAEPYRPQQREYLTQIQ